MVQLLADPSGTCLVGDVLRAVQPTFDPEPNEVASTEERALQRFKCLTEHTFGLVILDFREVAIFVNLILRLRIHIVLRRLLLTFPLFLHQLTSCHFHTLCVEQHRTSVHDGEDIRTVLQQLRDPTVVRGELP